MDWAPRALRFLSAVGDVLSSSLEWRPSLAAIARLVVPEIADACAIYVVAEDGTISPVALAHGDVAHLERAWRLVGEHANGDATLRRVLRTGKPLLVPHLEPAALRRFSKGGLRRAAWEGLELGSAVVVPLRGRRATVGVLQLAAGAGGRRFGEADLRLALDLAKRIAEAIEVARLIESRQRGIDRLRLLAEVGEALSDSLDLQSRFSKLANFVVPRMATWAAVNAIDEDGSIETVALAHRDRAMDGLLARLYGPYYGDERAAVGTPEVIRTGHARLIARVDDGYLQLNMRPETIPTLKALGTHSAIVVPLTSHGRTLGSLAAVRDADTRPFDENDVPLFEEMARRAAVAIENAKLFKRQQTVADTFQKASLPTRLPQVPGFSLSGFYEPGKSEALVGGDWYDAFIVADGRLVISIGDVSGSGLSAAVIMGSVRQVIRGASQLHPDPSVILDATDEALRVEHPERIVTAFVGVIDPVVRTLTYASAGHPPPLLRDPEGRVAELAAVGLPLGLRGGEEQVSRSIELPAGSLLTLYTDGLTESTRDLEEGERRVSEALANEAVAGSPDVAKALFERVLYDGSSDDVAILTIRVGRRAGAAESGLRLRGRFSSANGEAAHAMLARIEAFLRERGATEHQCATSAAVYLELIANVVRHAPGSVEVGLDWTSSFPVLHVLDDGPGFELPTLPETSDTLAENGRGIFLVTRFARDLEIRRRPIRGTHARAVLAVRTA
ncbi:MAG: SpoIIE family protein phosphatase [Candidatus Baltobacteraceae bacterium]